MILLKTPMAGPKPSKEKIEGEGEKMFERKLKNMFLIGSTRATSHLGSKCDVFLKFAKIGEDYSLSQKVAYQANGYDKLFIARIVYEDGMIFGDVLISLKLKIDGVSLCHIGSTQSWTMDFKKEVYKKELVINERKTYCQIQTKKVDNGYEYVVTEWSPDCSGEDNPEKFEGDYYCTCKACNSKLNTNFKKIFKCPICGYSKNNNIL